MSQNPQPNQNPNNINNTPPQNDEKYKKFFYNTENLENIYNILKGEDKQLKIKISCIRIYSIIFFVFLISFTFCRTTFYSFSIC